MEQLQGDWEGFLRVEVCRLILCRDLLLEQGDWEDFLRAEVCRCLVILS